MKLSFICTTYRAGNETYCNMKTEAYNILKVWCCFTDIVTSYNSPPIVNCNEAVVTIYNSKWSTQNDVIVTYHGTKLHQQAVGLYTINDG
ncbi:hypothetical protein CANCADRAFT_87678 [Tortispora caseinolytica NRRL Y-17796]|uniref:Uncharacterized protein n=1 Tax=Tortispora caseinolytica NRRL Y-17796 TaxID=767744 RepID=A0A1E4TLB3_9ASCO|nr:hypothetical protein CANCADRAFT_87678 [Tortispora caseinolytica NRRL Y-17796]